jgi:L-lactate dehydrogenase complex protein LldE
MLVPSNSRSVQLFGTCLVESLRPEVGIAVIQVLERQNIAVQFPQGQTCCGQPAFNAGAWKDARAMARHTLDVLSRSPAPIVVPSGSCAAMIVRHYPELFENDAKYGPMAESVSARTYEFSQYLVNVLGLTDFDACSKERLAYHASCHLLRRLGVKDEPLQLLSRVRGAELVELQGSNECCGFGGFFAIKMSDLSGAILKRKLDNVESSGAQTLVGCDVSCLLQISGGLHRRGSEIKTRHIAEILAG